MRAAYYERTGPARDVLRVGEVPTPEPGAGEVRVRLACSGVNPSDVKARAGVRSSELPFERIIPHSDGAGEIDAVGDGVDPARIGERVWVWNAAWGRAHGTAAEYVALPQAQAVRLPDAVDPATGACLGIPALTAFHAVHCNGGVEGATLLVAGGAGAVGHGAIEIARAAGAGRILSTVSSPEKAAIAAAAGADVTIDYRTEDTAARIAALTDDAGVDRIIEPALASNIALDLQAIRRGGLVVVYGSDALEAAIPFFPAILAHVRLQFFIVYTLAEPDRAAAIAGVTALLEQGALQPRVAATLPLDRVAEAHELVESGEAVGNVILRVDS